MKRLNRIARRITALDEAVEQFITECEDSGKFNEKQIAAIRRGFERGFTMEQMKFVADPKFSDWEMSEINQGFLRHLTIDQIKLYVDPKFNRDQMSSIRHGFEDGLSMDQMKFVADPKFDDYKMDQICLGLKSGITIEEMKNFLLNYNLKGLDLNFTILSIKKLKERETILTNELKEVREQLQSYLA